MRRFGERVKRFRMMEGMTQRQLAKAMHVALRTLQNVERAANEPRYSTINKFNRFQAAYRKNADNPSSADGFAFALESQSESTHV